MNKYVGYGGCAYGARGADTGCNYYKNTGSDGYDESTWIGSNEDVPSYNVDLASLDLVDVTDDCYSDLQVVEYFNESPRCYRICGNCLKKYRLITTSVFISLAVVEGDI